jgi:superfamily II DNA or RNA helicase
MRRAIAVKPSVRIAMVMGRVDLVTQTERALSRVIDRRSIGVYCGTLGRRERSRSVMVASIQSVADAPMQEIDLLIIDEVQNFDQRSGGYLRFVEKALEQNPRMKVVGVTATPFRANGEIFGDDMFFKRVAYRRSVKDMIAEGFLCLPRMKSTTCGFDTSQLRVRAGEFMAEDVDKLVSNTGLIEQQVADALSRMEGRSTAAWATANIDHCNQVLDALMARGERATSVHSKQNKVTRDQNLSAYMGGSCRHMVFVSVLSEGFDHPPIDTIVLMRPTRSPVLYVQTVGRGLRLHPSKADCLVLDYGEVVKNLGPLDNPNVKGKRKDADGDALMKACPACLSYVPGGCRTCPECQHEFPPPPPPEQKLTEAPDADEGILSKPRTHLLGPAEVRMHEAKSGNLCVMVKYVDGSVFSRYGSYGTAEFFVTTSAWAMQRLEKRLETIGAQLPGIPFEGTITAPGTFEVVTTKEGKYDRVMSVKKVSDTAPGKSGDENMSFDEDEEDDKWWTGRKDQEQQKETDLSEVPF